MYSEICSLRLRTSTIANGRRQSKIVYNPNVTVQKPLSDVYHTILLEVILNRHRLRKTRSSRNSKFLEISTTAFSSIRTHTNNLWVENCEDSPMCPARYQGFVVVSCDWRGATFPEDCSTFASVHNTNILEQCRRSLCYGLILRRTFVPLSLPLDHTRFRPVWRVQWSWIG